MIFKAISQWKKILSVLGDKYLSIVFMYNSVHSALQVISNLNFLQALVIVAGEENNP